MFHHIGQFTRHKILSKTAADSLLYRLQVTIQQERKYYSRDFTEYESCQLQSAYIAASSIFIIISFLYHKFDSACLLLSKQFNV